MRDRHCPFIIASESVQTRISITNRVSGEGGEQIYGRFPSKYFYLFGTTYYLNVYFRF